MHKVIAALLIVAIPAWAACPETWSDYSYQKTITIANGQVSGSGTHTSFPVLININDDADLKTVANSGHVEHSSGYDIAFYTPADGLLDYYRVKYDGGAGQGDLIAYVERDVSTSADTEICMRYGKSGASDLSSAANTFPLLIHYWPMETTDPADVIGGLTSTSAGDTTTAAGTVSLGLTHDGAGDYTDASGGTDPASLGDFAVSAWASVTEQTQSHLAMNQLDGTGTGRAWIYYDNPNDKFGVSLGNGVITGGAAIADTSLHFFAAEYDGTDMRISRDGASELTYTKTIEAATGAFKFGRHKSLTTLDWAGIIDEVMVWSEDKGLDWWLTMKNNGASPGTFYSVGSEATPSGGPAATPRFSVQGVIGDE